MANYQLLCIKGKSVIENLGIDGYGSLVYVTEVILSSPEKSMTRSQIGKAAKLIKPVLIDRLLEDTGYFYREGDKYFSEFDRKTDLTVEHTLNSLNKAGLSGRGFTRIMQIHGVSEKFMMAQFEKWKIFKQGEVFKNDKHIFDSFNYWMTKCEKEKVGKPANEIDWSKVK